ncbi:hypothetical protein HanXRQr2_Chr02g0058251 [Helianthus annuus]|uniref:Uncharacterized protein n=1 Tax=Helianthus annuus TaxID=4232 RepID=A0A9K3JLL5_HELAN|nr:hypothetical protein HanXRQr2_Chr02g0058251 [Helianthus annuus]KAJ0861918.1 hypothetical protein HanPSC8_Chr12g0512161 [Helianthus annuus]
MVYLQQLSRGSAVLRRTLAVFTNATSGIIRFLRDAAIYILDLVCKTDSRDVCAKSISN